MNRTKIEYLTHTYNPIAMRCTPVSPGCANCWHLRTAKRHAANPTLPWAHRDASAGGAPWLDRNELQAPLHRKKPSVIGVEYMGDLFHPDITREMHEEVFTVASKCPQHTFLFLTKRPVRMGEAFGFGRSLPMNWWVGVSIESQAEIHRWSTLDDLYDCPSVQWVSVEPMLGPVTFKHWPPDYGPDWVVCGPETGPKARPCDPNWIADLYGECRARGIPFFDKRKIPLAHQWPKGEKK